MLFRSASAKAPSHLSSIFSYPSQKGFIEDLNHACIPSRPSSRCGGFGMSTCSCSDSHSYNLWSSDYEGRFLVQLKVCLYRFLLNLLKIVYPFFFLLITPLSLHHFPRIITYIVVCNINYRHAIQMIIAYLRYPFTGDIYPPNH